MEISLVSQRVIKTHPGSNVRHFELPSTIARYLEYKDVVIFLLYDDFSKREMKIQGVKFSNVEYKLYTAWEFQIIDGLGEVHEIVYMVKDIFNNKEVVYCNGWGYDIGFYLDPDTGEVLHKIPIK